MDKIKKYFNSILTLISIVLVLFLLWRIDYLKKQSEKQSDELKKSIINNDKLLQIREGTYSKLVNYYNTEKELKNQLKDSNKELFNMVKSQDERILSLTNMVITLKGKIDEGFGSFNEKDTNLIDVKLRYPDINNPFITWDGSINKNTAHYKGEWVFGKLPLKIILTEEKRGLWKTYVDGPDWFQMDSLTINSLKPEELSPKEKNIQFLFGGGYNKSLDNTYPSSISIGGGVTLFTKHNIFVNLNTNKQVGVNYYYKLKSTKK